MVDDKRSVQPEQRAEIPQGNKKAQPADSRFRDGNTPRKDVADGKKKRNQRQQGKRIGAHVLDEENPAARDCKKEQQQQFTDRLVRHRLYSSAKQAFLPYIGGFSLKNSGTVL